VCGRCGVPRFREVQLQRRDHRRDRARERSHGAGPLPPLSSKRDLYLACLDAAWAHARRLWEDALANEPDPRLQLAAMGQAYIHQQRTGDKVMLSDLWIQALTEASEDPKIRRYLRDQVRGVHDFVADRIRRAQKAGGIKQDREPDAEAWIFISLGLLSTIDRRLGTVGDRDFEAVFASRRAWMTGEGSS